MGEYERLVDGKALGIGVEFGLDGLVEYTAIQVLHRRCEEI